MLTCSRRPRHIDAHLPAASSPQPEPLVLGGNLAVVAPWMLDIAQKCARASRHGAAAARLNIELSPLCADAVMMRSRALQKVDADLMQGKTAAARAG